MTKRRRLLPAIPIHDAKREWISSDKHALDSLPFRERQLARIAKAAEEREAVAKKVTTIATRRKG